MIKSDVENAEALAEVEKLMLNEPEPGTADYERMMIMALLIKTYEDERYRGEFKTPDPIGAIKFALERKGLKKKDLVPCVGPMNRVYDILNGKRSLTLRMIRKLHKAFDIPLEILVQA